MITRKGADCFIQLLCGHNIVIERLDDCLPWVGQQSACVQQLLQGAGAHAALGGQALLNVGHQAGHMAPATSTLYKMYEKIYF